MPTRLVVLLALALAATTVSAAEPVSVRQETLTIPTWEIGPPSPHPLYPGPQGRIYPYTLNDELTDRKVDREYQGVYLENEYVKVLVLPEIGGRLHGAVDKTNDYVWLYWQPTIKPGLISMTGAWISGGIEWNFPHGHRPSGFMPVDHRVVRHDDGSATVWVGETEPIYNTRWLVGMTLEPGRSRLRCDYVFVNPTNHRVSFQFWATAATHANEWSQAQYPGDVVAGHGKTRFWHWPEDDGVDLSWWRNVKNASSYFAYESQDDWFGVYDHRAGGGTVHVADHRTMPGKKLWTWGSGPSGRIWEDILTEGGGAYYEPQAGAFSDNQPDYHWMEPHEVRGTHDYWYPVRDTRGFRNANEDLALNTALENGTAFAAVHATGIFDELRVTLRHAGEDRVLSEAVTRVAPDRPFSIEVPVGVGVTVHDLHLAVHAPDGSLMLDLQQPAPREVPLPEPPREWAFDEGLSDDELFHCGEWLDRFRRTEEALECYEEALRRDPGDSRVNAEVGFLALKEARFADGLAHLDTALERDGDHPRLHFGRGLALLGLERRHEAEDAFSRAALGGPMVAAAALNLARLELGRGRPRRALERLRRAEAGNGHFADIPALAAATHRRLSEPRQALAAAERALASDPMHFMALREAALALAALGRPTEEWVDVRRRVMRGSEQNALTLAEAYGTAGLDEDAEAVLEELPESVEPRVMVTYLRALFRLRLDDEVGAGRLLEAASQGSMRGVHPHRGLEMRALEAALIQNPTDATAAHLLGNLLYGLGRREEAVDRWREALAADNDRPLTWRNLGYAQAQSGGDRAALAGYDQAFALDDSDPRVLLERDRIAEGLGIEAGARLALLENHLATVKRRGDLTKRWIDLLLERARLADLEQASAVLASRHFRSWEGAYELHHAWVEVQQALGGRALDEGDVERARHHFTRAAEYPKNLEVAPRTPNLQAHVLWHQSRAYEGEERTALLEAILEEAYPRPSLGTYYQALSLVALGREDEGQDRLQTLETAGREQVESGTSPRARAVGHYLLSLVLQESGDATGAKREREAARSLDARPDRRALTRAQIEYAAARQ